MSEASLSFPETERALASVADQRSLVLILASVALFLAWMGWFVGSRLPSGPSPAETVLRCASGASLR